MPAEFVDGMFFEKPAWHDLGTVIQERVTATEAAEISNGMYPMWTSPTFYKSESGVFLETGEQLLLRGAIPNHDPDNKIMGTVSSGYTAISNAQIAEILDPLSKEWHVETFGVLKDGQKSFWVLDMGQWALDGFENEQYKHYAFIANDVLGAIKWIATSIRVVCNNTWIMAENEGILEATISHIANPASTLRFEANFRKQMIDAHKLAEKQFIQMIKTPVADVMFNNFVDDIFPFQKVPARQVKVNQALVLGMSRDDNEDTRLYFDTTKARVTQQEKNNERAELMRKLTMDEYLKFNDEFPYAAESVYAMAQSANNIVNHTKSRGTDAQNAERILFNTGATQLRRIHQKAVELV